MFSILSMTCDCIGPEPTLPALSVMVGSLGLLLMFAETLCRATAKITRTLQWRYPRLFG